MKKLYVLLLAATLFACGDDDEPHMLDNPVVVLTLPPGKAEFYGTIQIKATATDKDEITSMKLFLDNATTPVDEVKTSSLDFTWNTEQVADGPHTLRIVATDVDGNMGEAVSPVVVRNTVLSIRVPDKALEPKVQCWVLVSDNRGQVLDYQQLRNDSTYRFKAATADYNGQDLHLTLLTVHDARELVGENIIILNTCTYIPCRAYTFGKPYSVADRLPALGAGHVFIADAPVDYEYLYGIQNSPSSGVYQGPVTYSGLTGVDYEFTFAQPDGAVLQSLTQGEELMYLYTSLRTGETKTQYVADFKKAAQGMISVPEGEHFYTTMTGTNTLGKFYYAFDQKGGTDKIRLFTMNDVFSEYTISVGWREHQNDNISHNYFYKGSTFPTRIRDTDASLTYSRHNDVIEYKLDGTCDAVVFRTAIRPGAARRFWQVWGGAGIKTIVMPLLPDALVKQFALASFADYEEHDSHTVYDYSEYQGYDAFIDRALMGDMDASEYTALSYWITTNGRGGNHAAGRQRVGGARELPNRNGLH